MENESLKSVYNYFDALTMEEQLLLHRHLRSRIILSSDIKAKLIESFNANRYTLIRDYLKDISIPRDVYDALYKAFDVIINGGTIFRSPFNKALKAYLDERNIKHESGFVFGTNDNNNVIAFIASTHFNKFIMEI